ARHQSMHISFPRRVRKHSCAEAYENGVVRGEGEFSYVSRQRLWPHTTCLNLVLPAASPHSFPFPATRNAAWSRGCEASCCESFRSERESGRIGCRAPAAADPSFPAPTEERYSDCDAFPACNGRA